MHGPAQRLPGHRLRHPGQLESHGRLRAVRKEIARIYTVKRERELGIVTVAEDAGEAEDSE